MQAHNNCNSSLWIYGTESATKFTTEWKLQEEVSPKERAKREMRRVDMLIRQSQFKNVDTSSINETKDMVGSFKYFVG